MSYARIDSISKEIKRELGAILPLLKDPRIPAMVSVVAVDVTKDLSLATVYVSILGNEQAKRDAVKGLNSAKSFVRHEVSKRVQLRVTPEISFVADDSIETGTHIINLINEIKKDDRP